MKTLAPYALVAAALAALFFLSGCTTGLGRRLAKMPDGRFKTATLEETGKFSTTTIKLGDARKDNGLLTAATIDVVHSNLWVQKLEFHATGYVVQLTPAEKKKPLPPDPNEPSPAAVPLAAPKPGEGGSGVGSDGAITK